MANVIVKDLTNTLRAGRVKRWHMNPEMNGCGENDAEHQWSTVAILLWLDPDVSRGALIAAIFHDVGELGAGDLSYVFKEENPAQAATLSEFEDDCHKELVSTIDRKFALLGIADRLSAWEMMTHHNPGLRHTKEWTESTEKLWCEAHNISPEIAKKVDKFILERCRGLYLQGK